MPFSGVGCGRLLRVVFLENLLSMGKRPAPAKAEASSEKKVKPEAKPVQEDPTSEFSAALTQRQVIASPRIASNLAPVARFVDA